MDGQATADLIKQFSKYVSGGNPRTVQRLAAELVTDRYQGYYPYAHQIGDTAAVVIIRQSGAVENYTIAWSKSGTPLTTLGASQSPSSSPSIAEPRATVQRTPFYQQLLQKFHNYTLPGRVNIVEWETQSQPVWALPEGFGSAQPARSMPGSLPAPTRRPTEPASATSEFPILSTRPPVPWTGKVRYMQTNTDVLVVDVMRNPAGEGRLAEDLSPGGRRRAFRGTSLP